MITSYLPAYAHESQQKHDRDLKDAQVASLGMQNIYNSIIIIQQNSVFNNISNTLADGKEDLPETEILSINNKT
jgi:hypothetical protein